jgi:formylglycine-generating enzyme required for sulfatase activity
MRLALIPAGRFMMGSPADDPDAYATEKPQHEVHITQPFYLGIHEVTVGQFEMFANATGHRTADERDPRGGTGFNLTTNQFEQRKAYSWRNPGFGQQADHPVVNVSWEDATAFCTWLAKKEGKPYRLPTEAEWEYACRAGSKTAFANGDDPDGLKAYANLADESLRARHRDTKSATRWDDGYPFTSPVGSFKANAYGLYDMQGNAWEWCADIGRDYTKASLKDPVGKAPGKRVLRGGSWAFGTSYARSALGNRVEPTFHYIDTGFRVALGGN